MNPTQLDQLLKFLTDTLQEGKDFTLEQAPQFVRELLLWRFWHAAVFMAAFVGVAVVFATFVASAVADGVADTPEENKIIRRWWRIGAAVLAIIAISSNGMTMIQVKVAPRVVLVEMVRDILGGRR